MSDPRIDRDNRQQVISDAIWDHAIAAIENNIPGAAKANMAIEDVYSALHSLVERLDDAGLTVVNRESISAYLLTHVGGDESTPWQAGHNYAMTEAARLIRESWDLLGGLR